MQLIRLEACFEDKAHDGIYQIIDPYLMSDYVNEASLLPLPNLDDIYENVSFWFTPEGWEVFGMSLLYLITEPKAWEELQKNDIHVFIGVTEFEKYHNYYSCDKYQVCLPYEEYDGWVDDFVELTPSNIDQVCDKLGIRKGW